ncbi:polyadenylate-binding protein RBP47-like [Tripterygium wilfordii]|uniref:Polyadenylate-binding protein RBP47-like n=1 Tax=Tripterygium wilfordii TaxID=458696 RepID=A0A7J7DI00_TRIWF|nr:polyadenylate-binding protein RBP47B-like isoform X1 [Tripterygium wilfordii]KAF5745686.1 polyadenylate-binding protein RBP47-like [Tripterygium wilfordii]
MQQANGGDQKPPPPSQQQHPWVPYQQQQQQQQWMAAMTYPAAAMAMMQQQMMMYPQHYMAYYQQQQQQQQYHQKQQSFQNQQQQPKSNEDVRTIWVGDLQHWMDETYLHSCFAHTGEVSSVKIIRNKQTGQPDGYGFVEFSSRATAEKILQSYNGSMMMPNTEHPFRLNWASFSAGDKRTDAAPDLSIFVGDLAPDVTDAMLQETFASRFSSIKGAKVVVDSNTGRSKGYGFVRFADENEKTRAMSEMNGVYCSSRPMRIGVATPKKSTGYQQQYSSQAVVLAGGHAANGSMGQGSQSDGELNNTTIFVGGVDSNVTEEDLRQPFSQFGEVVSVKIPVGKGCGFVQFDTRKSAEDALQSLNGTVIGNQTVRLSWGRSPGNKQWRGGDSSNQWSGAYHGGQGYGGGYGYTASSNQVPNMYGTAAASGAS